MHYPSCGWYDLPRAALNRSVGEDNIEEFEFCGSDGFFAEGALTYGPLEALDNAGFGRVKEGLVDLPWEGVVEKNVGAVGR